MPRVLIQEVPALITILIVEGSCRCSGGRVRGRGGMYAVAATMAAAEAAALVIVVAEQDLELE